MVSDWVSRWAGLLPAGASVLDVACGSGRHVRWLASQGFALTGVDRDAAALESLRDIAEVIVADIENGPWPLEGRQFDAVLVTNYLWRPLWPQLLEAVRPSGLLIYETFAVGNERFGKPSNPAFLLKPGELLTATSGWHVLAYEDVQLSGPERCVQRIVARRPAGD